MKKLLILVGAGKGLGNAIAKEFASHDFRVALIARNAENLTAYRQEFQALGYEVMTQVGDALYPETLTKAINAIQAEWGTCDALVYNVGITELDNDRPITNELLMQQVLIIAQCWLPRLNLRQNKGQSFLPVAVLPKHSSRFLP